MDPLVLQQQLKNNNKDLLDFCQDLKSWGEEMKKNEPQSKQKHGKATENLEASNKKESNVKKNSNNEIKETKKKMTYADWEKFDADKECEKVDEDSDSDLTDEFDESMKEEALAEKDKGNRFVKSGKWDEAIKCYTKAIEKYAYDPVFYANRALCYLKKTEMIRAENDCTTSLKLDNTYVKAYQRRAAARESLNKFEEAKLDLLRVLQLEPKNSESKSNLEKLKAKIEQQQSKSNENHQRPVSKFTLSRQQKKGIANKNNEDKNLVSETVIDSVKPKTIWPSGEKKNLFKAINKPPHWRSTKPLKRITIKEINSIEKEKISSWPNENNKNLNSIVLSDDLKIVEHKSNTTEMQKKEKDMNNVIFQKKEIEKLIVPKSSIQFHMVWKKINENNLKKYEYLKLIVPESLPKIFKESLESEVFSEVLQILADYFIGEKDGVYDYLFNFAKIKRFRALTMFLTVNDKNCLSKIFNRMKGCEGRSKEEIDDLIEKYELNM